MNEYNEQIADLINGYGYSSDKVLARYFGTTRKTIWAWSKDPDNPFPKPIKIGKNTTRWLNQAVKNYIAMTLKEDVKETLAV